MRVPVNEINGILSPAITGGKITFQNEREMCDCDELTIEFSDFIASQLDSKIIQNDFSVLVRCCKVINSITQGLRISNQKIAEETEEIYLIYNKLMALVGIYSHIKTGIRILAQYPEELRAVPDSILDTTVYTTGGSEFNEAETLKGIRAILLKEGMSSHLKETNKLDFKYLNYLVHQYDKYTKEYELFGGVST